MCDNCLGLGKITNGSKVCGSGHEKSMASQTEMGGRVMKEQCWGGKLVKYVLDVYGEKISKWSCFVLETWGETQGRTQGFTCLFGLHLEQWSWHQEHKEVDELTEGVRGFGRSRAKG